MENMKPTERFLTLQIPDSKRLDRLAWSTASKSSQFKVINHPPVLLKQCLSHNQDKTQNETEKGKKCHSGMPALLPLTQLCCPKGRFKTSLFHQTLFYQRQLFQQKSTITSFNSSVKWPWPKEILIILGRGILHFSLQVSTSQKAKDQVYKGLSKPQASVHIGQGEQSEMIQATLTIQWSNNL